MTARWQKYNQEALRKLDEYETVLTREDGGTDSVRFASTLAQNPNRFCDCKYFPPSELGGPVGPLGEAKIGPEIVSYCFKDAFGLHARININQTTRRFVLFNDDSRGTAPKLTIPQQRHLIQILQANVDGSE